MIFLTTANGTDRSARIVTSWLAATTRVLGPTMLFLSCDRRAVIGSIAPGCPSMRSATIATSCPCTMISSGLTEMITVSRGFDSTLDSGNETFFGASRISTEPELTSRKKTRIVNTSISDVRFIFVIFTRLRDMRFIRREFLTVHLQRKSRKTARTTASAPDRQQLPDHRPLHRRRQLPARRALFGPALAARHSSRHP